MCQAVGGWQALVDKETAKDQDTLALLRWLDRLFLHGALPDLAASEISPRLILSASLITGTIRPSAKSTNRHTDIHMGALDNLVAVQTSPETYVLLFFSAFAVAFST